VRGSLWVADRGPAAEYRKLVDLPSATHLRGIAWSPDGQSLLVGVDARTSDIVLAEVRR